MKFNIISFIENIAISVPSFLAELIVLPTHLSVLTVGLDYLSVSAYDDAAPTHHIFLRNRVQNSEVSLVNLREKVLLCITDLLSFFFFFSGNCYC